MTRHVSLAKAGPRYTPELHVDVEAVEALEGLGRTTSFETRWREALGDLHKTRQYSWPVPDTDPGEIAEALDSCQRCNSGGGGWRVIGHITKGWDFRFACSDAAKKWAQICSPASNSARIV